MKIHQPCCCNSDINAIATLIRNAATDGNALCSQNLSPAFGGRHPGGGVWSQLESLTPLKPIDYTQPGEARQTNEQLTTGFRDAPNSGALNWTDGVDTTVAILRWH